MGCDILKLDFDSGIGYGWSEAVAFAQGLTNPQEDLAAQNLIAQRIKWLVNTCKIIRANIHTQGPPRDVLHVNVALPVVGLVVDNFDTIQTCFSQEFHAGARERYYFGHGIPQTWIVNNATNATFTAARAASYDLWVTEMLNGNWGVQTLATVFNFCTSIVTPAIGQDAIVTLTAAWTGGNQGLLQVRGYRGDPLAQCNGFWKYLKIDPTHLQLIGSHRYQFNAPAGGIIIPLNRSSLAFTGQVGFKVTARDVGRVPGSFRGKTSAILFHK